MFEQFKPQSIMPILRKSDCYYQGNPKVIILNAYKLWKIQTPLRNRVEQEAKQIMGKVYEWK